METISFLKKQGGDRIFVNLHWADIAAIVGIIGGVSTAVGFIFKTADDALLPGYQQHIKADKIADFFKSATNAPTDEGVFETSLLCVETSNTAKLLQRFATLPDLNRYERVVEANVATSTVFPHGIGGGYSSVKNVGGWVKD